jgi:signal transduction histidine kinase
VITNLLVNAIKYGNGKPIKIITFKEGSIANFLIQDHGMGIEKEKQEMIFNRFERATDTQNEVSLGLGLYISRQIIEAHNGRLSLVESSENGTTFQFELPI